MIRWGGCNAVPRRPGQHFNCNRQNQAASGGEMDDTKLLRALQIVSVAWLVALGDPVRGVLQLELPPFALGLTLLGVASFAAVYVVIVFRSNPYPHVVHAEPEPNAARAVPGRRDRVVRWLPLGLLVGLGTLYTIQFGNPWLDFLVFAGVAAAYRLPVRSAVWAIPAIAVLAIALGIGINRSPGDTASAFLLIMSISIGVAGGIYTRAMVRELRAAREELARLAVAEERLRFARDLHDLLGHSLSLIALKSELAGQLALQSPERAAAEIRDVESVAREALREVREAVAGYRQPSLQQELRGAAEILRAAGISCDIVGDLGRLPPRVEAAFAWAVREGVTNVIRHSHARSCEIRLSRRDDLATVAVSDDGEGVGDTGLRSNGGRSGIAGLSERIAAVGGQVVAGPGTPTGFRLVATVPLVSEAGESARTIVTGGRS